MSTTRGRLLEVCIPFCFLLLGYRATAAPPPPLTTIQDELYRADGTKYSGFVDIEWNSFEAGNGAQIAKQTMRLRLFNGLLRVQLTPTTNATPAAFYKVTYLSDGKSLFTETWNVPASAEVLRVRDVRASQPGSVVGGGGQTGGLENITIADVQGLQAALNERPRAGGALVPGRTAMINALGELETVSGSDADCVHVDGSADLCGGASSTSLGAQFRDGETPSGAVNGTNATFTLSYVPNPAGSLLLYKNGLLQKAGTDFTLSSQTVTFLAGAIPQTGDILVAVYRMSGTQAAYSLVLCSNAGLATSDTAAGSLGSCTIPANVLQPGDRVEVQYTFTHEGNTTGFAHDLIWGGTLVRGETRAAAESASAGTYGFGAATSAMYWTGQSWGATSALAASAGSVAAVLSSPITIDFQARMLSATAETVTLRNFTVIRHPKP